MRVPPPFHGTNILNPHMAEVQRGSIFTPAIASWYSPGTLGALGLPAWAPYAGMGALAWLAWRRMIPWWGAIAGSGLLWWCCSSANAVTLVSNGVGIVANGTTIQFSANSPGKLETSNTGAQVMAVGGFVYPVLSTQANTDGTTTYYLDNPPDVAAVASYGGG